jgi:hypothetical protein
MTLNVSGTRSRAIRRVDPGLFERWLRSGNEKETRSLCELATFWLLQSSVREI